MHTGQDEYNDITLTNDNQPTNGTAYSFNTAEVEQPVAETSQTEETSDSRTHTKGKVVSKAVSNIITLTGVIVVATATGVAVAAELSEDEPDLPVEITAPLAEISQVETLYYGYDTELIIQYTFTDTDSEIADYYLWIEDSAGLTADCTVDSTSGTATANVTDLNVENGLTLVVYAYSNLGWYGEIYRDSITLPTAADVTLLDISTDGAFYEGEDSLYYITFEYYGDTTDITSYSYYFEDEDGNIFPCEDDGEGRAIITFTADTTPAFDAYGQLYFIATALTTGGWEGEIYRDKIVINPPAPSATVSDVAVTYYGYDTELIIQYTLTDTDSEIADYYLWIEDSAGLTADCTVDSSSGTATATVTDLNVENGLTLVVYAYSNLGWYGEIYRDEITLPTASTVTLLDISTDGAFYEGEDSLYYVTFEYYGDTTDITSYSYYFEDEDGTIFPCEDDGEGRAVITFAADTVPTFDTYGQLYFVATALTTGGWEGEIYRDKIVINPPAPSATVSDVAVTYYGYDTDLTFSYTLTDTDSEIAEYYLWIEDSVGLTADCTVDSTSGTATATVTNLNVENGLTLVVYAYSNLGWNGEIYRDEITLPTASTVTLLDISTDGAFYEGEDSLYYITFEYYGDTTDITSYSYYFEDEDGTIFPCEDDGEGRAVITFTADTVPTFDTYGQLYFVATALTTGGWEGEIYRDKIVINPPAPAATVSDVAVTYYGYDSDLTLSYTLTDTDSEIAEYYLWIEDSAGLTADCTVDSESGTATATVTNLDTENGLTLVVYAYSNLGWNGEIYRDEITLPTASTVTLLDISTDGAFYEGEDSLYYVTFAYYGDTTDIASYSYYFEDEDGTIFPCEDDGEGRAVITFAADTVPTFDTYGQLYFVATALTTSGWEGIIYKEKIVIATDGYAELPYVILVYMPYMVQDGVTYIYPEITVYDLDGIWTALTLTVTDAGGQEYTVDLINNEDVGYEMDDYDNTIYYVTIEGGSTFTIAEDGTVSVLITATWHEPDGNGGYNDYVTIVYEDTVLLEDTSG